MYFYDDETELDDGYKENEEIMGAEESEAAATEDIPSEGEIQSGQTGTGGNQNNGLQQTLNDLGNKRKEAVQGGGTDNPPIEGQAQGQKDPKSNPESLTDSAHGTQGNPKVDKPELPEKPGEKSKIAGDKAQLASKALDGMQQDGVKGATKEVAKEAAKQQVKKQVQKEIAKRGLDVMLKSLSTALAPILFWVAVVILIIIIAVGILMFFIAMPGQIVSKVRSLASNVMKAWSAMIEGEDVLVTTTQLADVANYIESMGYDLKGEGFVTYNKKASDIDETITNLTDYRSKQYDDSSDLKDMSTEQLKKLLEVDPVQGVIRRNDTQDVVDLNSESILSYIISDNQCYIIRNFNTTLDNMTEGNGQTVANIFVGVAVAIGAVFGAIILFCTPIGWIGALISGVVAAAGALGGSYLAVKMNNNPVYGRGLITLWHEGSRIGIVNGFYESGEKGSIALDAETKQLKIKRGWANGTYTFNIDGWSGRYGMPLEFLLSVHLATQMPDLAIEMATSFQTEVEVILHPVTGDMTAGVLKRNTDKTWHEPSADHDFITFAMVKALGDAEQTVGQTIWEGLKNFANGVTGFFTGDKVWTDEELDELGINAKVLTKLFDDGMPHANSCTCCSHITGSGYVAQKDADGNVTNPESCTADTDIYGSDGKIANSHIICKTCEDRALKIIAALAVTNDKEWESYTPYISKVKDHWFRDVYFVMNTYVSESQKNEFQSVIQVDEDYFYETGERWTMYETWEAGDTIPEGFEVGDYKLYEEGSNTPSKKTLAEVQEINEKIAMGDTTVTRLIKKAITKDLSANSGSDWSAYELTPSSGTSSWQQMSTSQDSKAELTNNYVYKDQDASTPDDIIIYYKESRPDDIKQVEDGQRTQTNEKIKNMFLNNKYYKYDGSVERADEIIEDRSRADNKAENYNTSNDNRKEELVAKVNITKDSLSAFSILENMHTMDADYIYRDFKELIVELDYFDKEDLSDKIQQVMQWPLPDTGSGGWPIRRYEKGETFYGTLINSKIDLELMRNADVEAAKKLLEQMEDEDNNNNNNKPVTATGTIPSGSVSDLVAKGYEVHAVMEIDKGSGGWDYCVYHKKENCTVENCKSVHCNHKYNHSCGLNSTIQEAQSNYHNTCCATFVSWVLKEAGFDLSNHPGMHGALSTYRWCEAENWTPITDFSELQPGDLLFNHSDSSVSSVDGIGHVQMLGDNGEWLNAGGVSSINGAPYEDTSVNFIIGMRSKLSGASEPFVGYEPNEPVVSPLTGRIAEYGEVERTNEETGEKEIVEFIKIEAIHNYLYDTSSPKGEGYKNCVKISGSGINAKYSQFKDKASEEAKKLEGYDYFYDEYQGVLDGFVLYIEGIDLTFFDRTANGDEADGALALVEASTREKSIENSDITRYEPNVVHNMTDNLKEARAIWKEDAKVNALPVVKIGDDIYIKEGTVIGKTMEDPDMGNVKIVSKTDAHGEEVKSCTGNGNYIRLILRDLEDSIVEDVENYMIIDDPSPNLNYEQFLYWLGVCLESGVLEERNGVWYSVAKDLGDGVGGTHFFGLTHYKSDLAKKLGYTFSSWDEDKTLEMLVDVYLAHIEEQKASINKELGSGLSDGYLFAFHSILHNYGNLTKRGDEYKSKGSVSQTTWCTYENQEDQYANALTQRRIAEWALITEGRYEDSSHTEIDFTAGGKFSEAQPFTDWCAQYGITVSINNSN